MIISDKSNMAELLAVFERLQESYILIGILGDGQGKEKHSREGDITLLELAAVHEFGVDIYVTPEMRGYLHSTGLHLRADTERIHIPERSYIRGSYDAGKHRVIKKLEGLLVRTINLEIPVDTLFKAVGEIAVSTIQEYLTDLDSPPLHDYTVAMKGSSNPLIDSGRLRQGIEYKVVRR